MHILYSYVANEEEVSREQYKSGENSSRGSLGAVVLLDSKAGTVWCLNLVVRLEIIQVPFVEKGSFWEAILYILNCTQKMNCDKMKTEN